MPIRAAAGDKFCNKTFFHFGGKYSLTFQVNHLPEDESQKLSLTWFWNRIALNWNNCIGKFSIVEVYRHFQLKIDIICTAGMSP